MAQVNEEFVQRHASSDQPVESLIGPVRAGSHDKIPKLGWAGSKRSSNSFDTFHSDKS